MMVRQKPYKLGDVVRVKNVLSYPLPPGLKPGTKVRVVGFDVGRRIVRNKRGEWSVSCTNIDSGFEQCR
jgi:hypothetical protein